jgi:mycothiol synthase
MIKVSQRQLKMDIITLTFISPEAIVQIYQRDYAGKTDHESMINLAYIDSSINLHWIDLPYRLSSWALDDPENAQLWVNSKDVLIAWAIMQTPFWSIDYVTLSDEKHLHRKILQWADQRANEIISTPYGHLSWFINVYDHQVERIQELESFGYLSQAQLTDDPWSKVIMLRDLNKPPIYKLPEGFIIRSLIGESEVEAYVELHQTVFGTKNMIMEWRERTIHHVDYHPDLDLVALTPNGRLAGFCIGWMSRMCGEVRFGQIEPMGVHVDFRGLGIGKALLSECIRRLQINDVRNIYVETDNYRNAAYSLYKELGFHVIHQVRVYGKEFNTDSM